MRCPKSCPGSEVAGRKSWSLGSRGGSRRGGEVRPASQVCTGLRSGSPGASQPLVLFECSVFGGFRRRRSASGDECAAPNVVLCMNLPEEKVGRWVGTVVRGGAVKSGQPPQVCTGLRSGCRVQLGHWSCSSAQVFGEFRRRRSASGDECAAPEFVRVVNLPEEKVGRWIRAVVRGWDVKSGESPESALVFALVRRVQVSH